MSKASIKFKRIMRIKTRIWVTWILWQTTIRIKMKIYWRIFFQMSNQWKTRKTWIFYSFHHRLEKESSKRDDDRREKSSRNCWYCLIFTQSFILLTWFANTQLSWIWVSWLKRWSRCECSFNCETWLMRCASQRTFKVMTNQVASFNLMNYSFSRDVINQFFRLRFVEAWDYNHSTLIETIRLIETHCFTFIQNFLSLEKQ